MLTYYAEGFTDLGFITLFAAAFPLGPFVLVLSNIIEIWSKIFVFLNVYRRPDAIKCLGIGYWVEVWEGFNFLSIFSNMALLYSHHTDFFYFVTGSKSNTFDAEDGNADLLIFLTATFVLFAINSLLDKIIGDKPQWIIDELEKKDYLQKRKMEKGRKYHFFFFFFFVIFYSHPLIE